MKKRFTHFHVDISSKARFDAYRTWLAFEKKSARTGFWRRINIPFTFINEMLQNREEVTAFSLSDHNLEKKTWESQTVPGWQYFKKVFCGSLFYGFSFDILGDVEVEL